MALEKHVVELTAKDSVSPALQKIGKAATDAGLKAEQGAQKAARATKEWGAAAVKVGAVMGTLVGVTSALGQAHGKETMQLKALDRAYGESADQIDDFAQKLQDMGIASDDSTRIAALGAQSLAKNYGLTTAEILQLVERSADLTQTTFDQYGAQLSLSDVMQRVQSAIRGEAESAEVLGVAMSDTRLATLAAEAGLVGWTTTMTDAEKAAFRLKVFLDDTSNAQGAAAERSDTLAGKVNAVKLEVLDYTSVLGGMLGPLGESTALLGNMALAMPLVGAGVGQAATGFKNLSTAIKGSTTLMAAGPWLGLAAVAGAAAFGVYELHKALDAQSLSASEATNIINDLNTSLGELALGGASPEMLERSARATNDVAIAAERINKARAEMQELEEISGPDLSEADFAARQRAIEANILSETEFQELVADTQAIARMDESAANFQLVQDRAAELNYELEQNVISVDQFAREMDYLNDNLLVYGITTEGIIEHQKSLTAVTRDQTKALIEQAAVNSRAGFDKMTEGALKFQEQVDASAAASKQLSADLDALAVSLEYNAGGAAAAAYERVVGLTSGVTASIQTIKDWTDSLFDSTAGLSIMDDLMARGIIDAEDKTEALKAQYQTTDALAESTDAMNEIQIKQASTLADGAMASADYLQNIAKLDEAEQALALAWADTDIAGRANEIAGMATQFGNMDGAQKQAFENMVLSAAATDPELARVLDDLNIIEKDLSDPTGWKMSIDESSATASLQDVVDAINRLIDAINGVPDVYVDASLDTTGFWNSWRSLPDSKVINVWTNNIGFTEALGGNVGAGALASFDAAALGGVSGTPMTLVGEHGPELVSLPIGSHVTPNHATQYMGKGGGSFVIQNMTVVANNPEQFMQQMRSYQSTMERR